MERNLSTSRAAERELVLAFQSGDAAAFESIVRTCRPAAERICRRLLVNPADAEEAVQETMVRAYQGLPRFNGSYALTAWIARIATNVSLDALRASSRRPQNGGTIEPETEALASVEGAPRNPEELVELADQAREVRDVLASLPEQHRTALVLREFEGYSHRQIAGMLDTSPARVKALIHRAKAGFRRAWSDEHHPGRLAAFAPLLTPINWFRRALGRAPEFDYSSTTSAASAATAVSSPAAHTLATIASERVSVLATVMLAGTMGFAVQNAPDPSRADEKPVAAEVVEAPPAETRDITPKVEPKKEEKQKARPEPKVIPTPTVTPSVLEGLELEEDEAAVVPSPSPSPKEGTAQPGGGGAPAAPPAPPPHSATFAATGYSSEEQCGCPPIALKGGSLEGQPGGEVSFEQKLSGALQDAEGDPAWEAEVSISGRAGGEEPAFDLAFKVFSSRGMYVYDGQAAFGGVLEKDGVWTYGFEGAYSVRSGPGQFDQMPRSGTLRVELAWGHDGSPVRTSLTLA